MRTIAAQTIARVNADWTTWQQIRVMELEQLNRRLKGGKLAPILVPTESELHIGEPHGGEELP